MSEAVQIQLMRAMAIVAVAWLVLSGAYVLVVLGTMIAAVAVGALVREAQLRRWHRE